MKLEMSKMVRTIAVLLIVFSTARAHASLDSASLAAYCKVMPVETEKQYRLVYQSPATQNVEIQLLDSKQNVIYNEKLVQVTGFVKNYDLANVPVGTYTFKVVSADFSYSELVQVADKELRNIFIAEAKDGKVAMVGKNDSGSELSLHIYDEEGNSLYKERISSDQEVSKVYDMKRVPGKQVSFVIYENDRVVKTTDVKL